MKTLAELRAQFPQYDSVSDGDFLLGLNRKLYPNVHPRTFLNSIEGGQNAHATIRNDALKSWYRENVVKPLDGEDARATAERLGGTANEQPISTGGAVGSAARGLVQGMTFGGGDELVAAGVSALSDQTYDQALADERKRLEMGRDQNPVASYGSELAGAVAMPLGAVSKTGKVLTDVGKSVATSGLLGSAYGFLSGEGGAEARLGNAASTGAISGLLGGAIPLVGQGIARAYNGVKQNAAVKAAVRSAPSMDELQARASAIYKEADNAVLPRAPFANAAQDAIDTAARKGMDADLTPGAAKVADRLTTAANDASPTIGFSELDILRRKAAIPAGNVQNRTEAAIGTGMIDNIDNFVDSVDPALAGEIGKARDMWGRLRRSELIQNAVDRAKNQASGFENGLRIHFRAILNNKKLSRGFSEAEKDAMRAVVEGTTFGNIMKKVGIMGLSGGQGGSGLGVGLGSAFGATVGSAAGPLGAAIGAAVPLAIGSGAKKLAEMSTRKAADRAAGLVAAGGVSAAVPQMSPTMQRALEAAMRRGMIPQAQQIEGLLGANVGSSSR